MLLMWFYSFFVITCCLIFYFLAFSAFHLREMRLRRGLQLADLNLRVREHSVGISIIDSSVVVVEKRSLQLYWVYQCLIDLANKE